jgi:hypothetical protein
MDKTTGEQQTPTTRKNYDTLLDAPLAKTRRKIAVSLAVADDIKEGANMAGTSIGNIHMSNDKHILGELTIAGVMQKRKILDKLVDELSKIVDMTPETPLKYSDKLRAIELMGEFTEVTGKKGGEGNITINNFDLRSASESELVQQLDALEKKPGDIIDVTPVQ